MHQLNFSKALLAAACATAALLSACGGSDDPAGPRVAISRVVVAGDSLADVGTFGFKFTVQNAASAGGFPIFPQIVAQNFGIDSQCNFYRFTGTTFTQNSTPGCTNYAIGASRVANPASQGGAAGPQSIGLQLATAANVAGGTWTANDLILVDGGGNDAADLVGAYLGLSSNSSAGLAAYIQFLSQQLDTATIGAALQQPNGPAVAAGLYMQKLADTYYNSIKASALDKGATHVAVLNVPDITLTPRFQAVLGGVAKASGGGTAGATVANTLQGAIRQWIGAFNSQLKTRVAGDTRVALVDFNADFTDEVSNPTAYALTNVTQAACPVTGLDSSGLPAYTFPTCTSAALDAAPPAGAAAGWWQSWTFSDGFHPTPYGHRLLASSVSRALARAGWL